jgi:hypothetical protein
MLVGRHQHYLPLEQCGEDAVNFRNLCPNCDRLLPTYEENEDRWCTMSILEGANEESHYGGLRRAVPWCETEMPAHCYAFSACPIPFPQAPA